MKEIQLRDANANLIDTSGERDGEVGRTVRAQVVQFVRAALGAEGNYLDHIGAGERDAG